MAKVFGLLMIVGLVWVGLEVYTEGTHGAFGGIFAGADADADAGEEVDDRTPGQRGGAALERAHQARGERFDKVYDQVNQ